MYERNAGRIINTASQLAYLGAPGFSHYTATKGAILSFTRSVALEIGARNVRAHAVPLTA
jgi:3-oxoacyl-[acyl-carrier protein] reductase